MTILLVRHAESLANIDVTLLETIADHAIPLTEKGKLQARELGVFLKDWYSNNPPKSEIRLWASPYKRTTQTLVGMKETIGEQLWNTCGRGHEIHFDDRLREREWGYYHPQDYHSGSALEKTHPDIHRHLNKVRDAEMGQYFYRPHGGESVADIAGRLRSFFHDLYFDIGHGITDHLIITHARTMHAFAYAFTKTHPAFLDKEPLTGNTSVRLLDIDPATNRYMDYGMIYDPDQNIYLLNRPDKPLQRDVTQLLE